MYKFKTTKEGQTETIECKKEESNYVKHSRAVVFGERVVNMIKREQHHKL